MGFRSEKVEGEQIKRELMAGRLLGAGSGEIGRARREKTFDFDLNPLFFYSDDPGRSQDQKLLRNQERGEKGLLVSRGDE